jgi:hypothetical protein
MSLIRQCLSYSCMCNSKNVVSPNWSAGEVSVKVGQFSNLVSTTNLAFLYPLCGKPTVESITCLLHTVVLKHSIEE